MPVRQGVLPLPGQRAGEPGAHVPAPGIEIAVGAVRDAGLEVPVGLAQRPVEDMDAAQVGEGPGGVLVGILGQGQVQALRQPRAALRHVAGGRQRRAHVVQRVHLGITVAEPAGQLDRPRAPPDGGPGLAGQHAKLSQVAVRHGQLRARLERLQRAGRRGGVALAVRVLPQKPGQPRQPPLGRADLAPGPLLLVDGQRGQRAVAGQRELVGQVALVGQLLEQAGAGQVGPLVMPQRQLELLGRLAMRAETRGPGRGERSVAYHSGLVAAAGRVVGQPPVVLRTARDQRGQGRGVRRGALRRRQGSLDCQPRQVMPESHRIGVQDQHAVFQAFVDGGERLRRHDGEKIRPGPPAEDRSGGGDLPPRPRQPRHAREHGIADRGRHRPGAGRDHLGDVERVPAGELEERVGVQSRAGRVEELPHAGDAERGKLHPDHAGCPREITHRHGQRVLPADLLGAEGGQDHQPGPGQPAAQEAQDVQGRLVGPVDVLEQEQHRGCGQHVADLTEQPEPAHAGRTVDRGGELGQGVEDGPERLGRRDAVAGAAPDRGTGALTARPGLGLGGISQGGGERGLADSGLPAQEHQPAAPASASPSRLSREARKAARSISTPAI